MTAAQIKFVLSLIAIFLLFGLSVSFMVKSQWSVWEALVMILLLAIYAELALT